MGRFRSISRFFQKQLLFFSSFFFQKQFTVKIDGKSDFTLRKNEDFIFSVSRGVTPGAPHERSTILMNLTKLFLVPGHLTLSRKNRPSSRRSALPLHVVPRTVPYSSRFEAWTKRTSKDGQCSFTDSVCLSRLKAHASVSKCICYNVPA